LKSRTKKLKQIREKVERKHRLLITNERINFAKNGFAEGSKIVGGYISEN